jgi:hypothetical protein
VRVDAHPRGARIGDSRHSQGTVEDASGNDGARNEADHETWLCQLNSPLWHRVCDDDEQLVGLNAAEPQSPWLACAHNRTTRDLQVLRVVLTDPAARKPTRGPESDSAGVLATGRVTVSGFAEEDVNDAAVVVAIGPKPSGGYWFGHGMS